MILSNGCEVELVGHFPEEDCDSIIASAARASFNNFSKRGDDERLIEYLMKNRHTSPFEMGNLTFLIKAPKFVTIQLLRHRTFKFNEESQRYRKITDGYMKVPLRLQSDSNKQCSKSGEVSERAVEIEKEICNKLDKIFDLYGELLDEGVARECARFCLPMSTWSHIVVQCDLSNFMKFLSLRTADDAQEEIRVIALAMKDLTCEKFPITMGLYDKYN